MTNENEPATPPLPPKKSNGQAKEPKVSDPVAAAQREVVETKGAALDLRSKVAVPEQHEEIPELPKDAVYYSKCQYCGGPGFYIDGPLTGKLTPDQWWSAYKPKGLPYPSQTVFCQCCAEDGLRNELRVFTYGKDDIGCHPRFMRAFYEDREWMVREGRLIDPVQVAEKCEAELRAKKLSLRLSEVK